jgi:WD40 repeat protein
MGTIEGADTDHPKMGKAEPLVVSPLNEGQPAISADGEWVAYQTNEAGANEIFVRHFPGPGGKWRVSIGGGSSPVWSRKGRELYYQREGIMAVTHSMDAGNFNPGRPRLWAEHKGIYGFAACPRWKTGGRRRGREQWQSGGSAD